MTLVKFKHYNPAFHGLSRSLGFPSLFNEALDRFWTDDNAAWVPSVNIKEGNSDFRIDMAVPGMDKKDFKIEVENGVLTVSGERKEEVSEDHEKHTRREFHYGSFKRSFSLPESANAEAVSANYNNGILAISIAKKDSMKQKEKKQIEVA